MMSFVVWEADNMETMRTFQTMYMVLYKLDNKFVRYRRKRGSFM